MFPHFDGVANAQMKRHLDQTSGAVSYTHLQPPTRVTHRAASLLELRAMMQVEVPCDNNWNALLEKPSVAKLSREDVVTTFEQKLVPKIEICDNGFPDQPRLWCWDCLYAPGGDRDAPQFKSAVAKRNVYAAHLALAYFKLPLPEQAKEGHQHASHLCEGRFCARPHATCCRPDHLVVEDDRSNHQRKNCRAWVVCEHCQHVNNLCSHSPKCMFSHK